MRLTDNTTYVSFYLKDGKIHVYADAIRSIGSPNFIRFLFNHDSSSMIMEPYHKKEFQSIRVKKENNRFSHELYFRCKPLCRLIEHTRDWNHTYSYRIPGRLIQNQCIVLFDLTQPTPISSQDSVNRGVIEHDLCDG